MLEGVLGSCQQSDQSLLLQGGHCSQMELVEDVTADLLQYTGMCIYTNMRSLIYMMSSSLGHSSYTDEYHPATRLTPVEKILAPSMTVSVATASQCIDHLLQIKEVDPVPPTPLQSYSDFGSLTARDHSPSSTSSDSLMQDSSTDRAVNGSVADRVMPPLKISKSSPSSSQRIKSASKMKKTDGTKTQKSKSEVVLAGTDVTEGKVVNGIGNGHNETVRTRSSDCMTTSQPGDVWESEITPLMHSLHGDGDISMICGTCDQLCSALQHHQFTGRTAGGAGKRRRSRLLKILFDLLEYKEPKLLIKVARIILMVRTKPSLLTVYCYHW